MKKEEGRGHGRRTKRGQVPDIVCSLRSARGKKMYKTLKGRGKKNIGNGRSTFRVELPRENTRKGWVTVGHGG